MVRLFGPSWWLLLLSGSVGLTAVGSVPSPLVNLGVQLVIDVVHHPSLSGGIVRPYNLRGEEHMAILDRFPVLLQGTTTEQRLTVHLHQGIQHGIAAGDTIAATLPFALKECDCFGK